MSDITKKTFEPGTFDVIYSRDSILHIGDKEELFANCFVRAHSLSLRKNVIENTFSISEEMAETRRSADDK